MTFSEKDGLGFLEVDIESSFVEIGILDVVFLADM